MPEKEKLIIDEDFRRKCWEAYLKADESGELLSLMNRRVLSTKVTLPKEQKEN